MVSSSRPPILGVSIFGDKVYPPEVSPVESLGHEYPPDPYAPSVEGIGPATLDSPLDACLSGGKEDNSVSVTNLRSSNAWGVLVCP